MPTPATRIDIGDPGYPAILRERMGTDAPPCLHALGDPKLLRHRYLGMVCSVRCPDGIVLRTLDAIRALRDRGTPVIGGFHSPMERECLGLLLRGTAPVILCPARGLAGLRLGADSRAALATGRLLALSPFANPVRRATSGQALLRNRLVSSFAGTLWVPCAASGGGAWATARAALERGQPVVTFDTADNTPLVKAGARPFLAEEAAV